MEAVQSVSQPWCCWLTELTEVLTPYCVNFILYFLQCARTDSPGPGWCTHELVPLPWWPLLSWGRPPTDLTDHQHSDPPHTDWSQSKIPATHTHTYERLSIALFWMEDTNAKWLLTSFPDTSETTCSNFSTTVKMKTWTSTQTQYITTNSMETFITSKEKSNCTSSTAI